MRRNLKKYALYGFLFGICFPLFGLVLLLVEKGEGIGWQQIWELQQAEYLLWIIETAPLILAWLAALIGKGQDRLELINRGLENEVKRQTESLSLKNQELEAEIVRGQLLTDELMEAKVEAESAARAKSEFLSTMSHEIRTPMNAVIGMTDLLQGTKLDQEQEDFVETIRISGENLLHIINDILDFSKIEAGKMEIDWAEIDLYEPIEDTVDLLSTKAHAKGLELLVSIEKEVPRFIIADATKIRQIVINLTNNAIKFTSDGEILVTASYLGSQDGKEGIQISVHDTGIGIPEEKLHRLFQSFSQVDASTTRKYGGTGLGLAISKRMVEMMGGKIWVESTQGQGSSFHFTLWVDKASKEWSLPDLACLRGKTALLLDDNATNLKILQYHCQEWGLNYHCFQVPVDLLEQLGELPHWDFGIFDMEMPEVNGAQVARKVKSHPLYKDRPLILLSSISIETGEKDKALFAKSLFKPARKSVLLNRILELYSEKVDSLKDSSNDQVPATSIIKQSLQNLRILLAEDNIINQKVARKTFSKLGFDIEIVENGQLAIEAVQGGEFDLVFMDVQMPVLDGLRATQRIRQELNSQPIIIAMTANAFKEDRDACLEAGMDDFLSKPIQIEKIAEKLLKWFELKENNTFNR